MAVTTQAVVQNVARLLGGFQAVTGTGSGTSTTVVDTNLKNYVNDSFASWWLRATSGTNDGEERRVKSLVQSTGTLTVETAFTASTDTSHTFELHKVLSPDRVIEALATARHRTFPTLSKLVEDTSLMTNALTGARVTVPRAIEGRPTAIFPETPMGEGVENFLSNADAESTDDLTATNVTLSLLTRTTGYTDVPKYGSGAVKVVAGASSVGTIAEGNTATVADMRGIALSYARWVYSLTASRITVQINDGIGTTSSSTHGGTGWELLHVTRDIVTNASALTPAVSNTSSAAFTYFLDQGWFYQGTKPPMRFNHRLERWQYHDRVTRELAFFESLPHNRQLYIQGQGLIEEPTAYSTSLSITEQQAELLAIVGAIETLKRWRNQLSGLSRDQAVEMQADFERALAQKKHTLGRRARNIRVVRA